MKSLKTLLLLLCLLLAINISFAQSADRLKLSNPYPERGEKVSFSYNVHTELTQGTGKIAGTVWFIEDAGYPSAPIAITGDGNTLTGEFTVSANARAFFIKIAQGEKIDNNRGKGYISMVYKDKNPVEGAYAGYAFILSSGIGSSYANLSKNIDDAVISYKKEFELYPQSEKKYTNNYYSLMAQSADYDSIVDKKIAELSQSNNENDLLFAVNLLRTQEKMNAAEALTETIRTKFPMGRIVLNDQTNRILNESDIQKRDELLKEFLVKYKDAPASSKDGIISNMVFSYLRDGDIQSAEKYSALLSNRDVLPSIYNSVASNWAATGQKLTEAEKLSKQAVDVTLSKAGVTSIKQITKTNAGSFPVFADTYAYTLFKQGKLTEALNYEEVAYSLNPDNRNIIEHYLQMLNSSKQYKKALAIAEAKVREGKSTPGIESELKIAKEAGKGGTKKTAAQ